MKYVGMIMAAIVAAFLVSCLGDIAGKGPVPTAIACGCAGGTLGYFWSRITP